MADEVLKLHMRGALDDGLRATVGFARALFNDEGHVDCVDGDIDTADVADEIITTMTNLEWTFFRGDPVAAISKVLAETAWLTPGSLAPEYVPALARDILSALTKGSDSVQSADR